VPSSQGQKLDVERLRWISDYMVEAAELQSALAKLYIPSDRNLASPDTILRHHQ